MESIEDRLRRVASGVARRSPAHDALVIGVIVLVVVSYLQGLSAAGPGDVGRDLTLYQREAQAWLGGAPMYPAFETQGPFVTSPGVILYPPITIAFFIPSLLLPLPLWWLIPAVIIGTVLFRLRPSDLWLIAIGFCLAEPISVSLEIAGNPDMWLAAALAIAVYWRPAAAFLLLKPSVFPLALVGVRGRGWWVIAGLFAIVSLALLPQNLDWLTVVRNAQGGLRSGLTYSLWDLPLLAVPLIAWAGSIRAARVHAINSERGLHSERDRLA